MHLNYGGFTKHAVFFIKPTRVKAGISLKKGLGSKYYLNDKDLKGSGPTDNLAPILTP